MSIFMDIADDFKDTSFNPSDSFVDREKDLPTKMVSIYEIAFNPMNNQGDTQEELEEFAEVIYEEGQIRSPLNVYKKIQGDKKYMLLGGDRRLHALLINAEKYQDTQKLVPVIVEKAPTDEIEEEMKILELNEHRALTPEREKNLVGRYLRIYRKLEERGLKPKGQVRKWIAQKMNIGEKKAEKYIHELEGYSRSVKKKEEKPNSVFTAKEKDQVKTIIKNMSDDLGCKVKITDKKLEIEHNGMEDLASIFELLGITPDGFVERFR